jgi:hypothetical protein
LKFILKTNRFPYSVCGSWLADPVATYPDLFKATSGSPFGGATVARWLTKFPYMLPALLSAFLMLGIGIMVFLIIEEVGSSDHIRNAKPDGR